MQIKQLEAFVELTKCRNFTETAKKVKQTQSAVSLQIKFLEEEFQTKLFERLGGRRKVHLTDDGQIFLDLISHLLAKDITTLKERFDEARGDIQRGKLRLATHASVMMHILPEIIRQFKKKYPEYGISIMNCNRDEIIAMLNSGDADIGITSLTKIPDNMEYEIFAHFDRILIAPKDHPLSKKKDISLRDLTSYPLILPPKSSNTRKVIEKKFEEKSLKYNLAMEITGREAIKTYVGMDLGISIINEYYLNDNDKKDFFVKNMSKHFGQAERGILKRKGKYLSKLKGEFVQAIVDAHRN